LAVAAFLFRNDVLGKGHCKPEAVRFYVKKNDLPGEAIRFFSAKNGRIASTKTPLSLRFSFAMTYKPFTEVNGK
jgi:hypothetical protein